MAQLDAVKINYAREFTKLSLWYVDKRLKEGDEDLGKVVNTRVNIYRNTSLYDFKHHPSQDDVGPQWKAILEQLQEVFERCADDSSTARLEGEGLEILWPYLGGTWRAVAPRCHLCRSVPTSAGATTTAAEGAISTSTTSTGPSRP